MAKTGVSIITMGAGNVLALKETLESFKNVYDEVIYGDLLLFPDDRNVVESYREQYNLKIIPFKFDFLFDNGFSVLLNALADNASNDMVMYMNTSEAIDEDYGIVEAVNKNTDCNSFFFIHRTDPHRWFRCYNRRELKWSGRIHESLEGDYRPYHKPIFMMKDLPKDMNDPFRAKCFDSVKEIVYFENYMSIVDEPESLGATDPGWVKFAKDNYGSMAERLAKKGRQYEAFLKGDFKMLMMALYSDPTFSGQNFESNIGIEYQQDLKFLGK